MNDETEDLDSNSNQTGPRRAKIVLAIVVALAIIWFVVETIMPAPFPHMAY